MQEKPRQESATHMLFSCFSLIFLISDIANLAGDIQIKNTTPYAWKFKQQSSPKKESNHGCAWNNDKDQPHPFTFLCRVPCVWFLGSIWPKLSLHTRICRRTDHNQEAFLVALSQLTINSVSISFLVGHSMQNLPQFQHKDPNPFYWLPNQPVITPPLFY